eukprot:486993-Pleurochrysis_carterae.AAC.1
MACIESALRASASKWSAELGLPSSVTSSASTASSRAVSRTLPLLTLSASLSVRAACGLGCAPTSARAAGMLNGTRPARSCIRSPRVEGASTARHLRIDDLEM